MAELHKSLESKETALDKLRKDRDELWSMVNADKYKNFKSVDEEKQRFDERITMIQGQLEEVQRDLGEERQAKDELSREVQRLQSFNQQLQESDASQKMLLQTISDQNEKQKNQLEKSESLQKQTTELLEQLKNENDKLKHDVTWLANSAKNSKIQSEKAIGDLEEYTKILGMMDAKLKQTEQERDMNKKECLDLQNCLN